MRVASIVAVLLIAAANAVALALAGEAIRPYLAEASVVLAVLALIGTAVAAGTTGGAAKG